MPKLYTVGGCVRDELLGLKSKDIGSERWNIAEQVSELFVDAIDDLLLLMKSGKIELPKKDDVFKGRVKWE